MAAPNNPREGYNGMASTAIQHASTAMLASTTRATHTRSMPRLLRHITAITCAMLFSAASIQAATIHVPADYADVQSAINASINGDVIEIAAGTYTPSATLNTNGKAITLRGAVNKDGSLATVLDGAGNKRVFVCMNGEGSATRFENLMIRNGATNFGGGMFCSASSPTLINCTFQANIATNYGGGMYCSTSSPTLTNCIFDANTATGFGGGLYCSSSPNLTLVQCTFTANAAANGGGMNSQASNTILTNCTFEANTATNLGGGIHCGSTIYSHPTLTNCIFTANTATNSGGGVRCTNSSPTLMNCTFEANTAGSGGGIESWESGPNLTNCAFEANSAYSGGGMYCYNSSSGTYSSPTLTNCTFSANIATGNGGGMLCATASSSYDLFLGPTLTNCTFEANLALNGGGLYNSTTFSSYGVNASTILTNCIFGTNSASASGGGVYCYSSGWTSSPILTNCRLCGNAAPLGPQIYRSKWVDASSNCFTFSCDDSDGDNWPDQCEQVGDGLHHVPREYPSIEAAIAASGNGDTIEVAAGTYFPAVTLNPLGKRLTLRGAVHTDGSPATTLDGAGNKRVLQCDSGEGPATRFENLVIRNGSATFGGGVYCQSSRPVLINCTVELNSATNGGGVYCYAASPTLTGCTLRTNTAATAGGGMTGFSLFQPTLTRCLLCSNTAPNGSQIFGSNWIDGGENCISTECITCDGDGDGVSDTLDNCPAIANADQMDCDSNSIGDVCQIAVDPSLDCDNSSTLDSCDITNGEADIDNDGTLDSCEYLYGDFDLNGIIDAPDLAFLLSIWELPDQPIGDITGDGLVNAADLAALLSRWGRVP